MKVGELIARSIKLANGRDDVERIRQLVLSFAVNGKLSETEYANSAWNVRTIGELTVTKSGGTPSRQRPEFWKDGTIPWIGSGALKDKVISRPDEHITKLGLESSSANIFPKDTVVIALTGATTGKVGILDFPCSTNQSVTGIFPNESLIPKYLFFYLRSIRPSVLKKTVGSAQPHINKGIVDGLLISFPPLAEQKRIVAKVDELMALCDRLEAQLKERDVKQATLAKAALAKFTEDPTPENLKLLFHPSFSIEPDDLRKSILNLAVQGKLVPQDTNDEMAEKTFDGLKALSGDSYDGAGTPSQWVHCSYRSLTTLVTSGSRGWKEFYAEKGSIFIRTQNIKTDKLVLDDIAFVDLPKSAEGMRAQVLRDDILITITGANVTKAARIEETIPEAYVSQHIALTRPRWSKMSEWLHLCFISHGSARGVLERLAYGDKPGLNLNNIRDLVIPIPPYAEQLRVVEKVKQLMTLVDALETQLEASHTTGEKLLEAMISELTATDAG